MEANVEISGKVHALARDHPLKKSTLIYKKTKSTLKCSQEFSEKFCKTAPYVQNIFLISKTSFLSTFEYSAILSILLE